MKHIENVEDSFPLMYVFSSGETVEKIFVVGDKTVIDTNVTDFYQSLIILIAVYYTFGIDYPKAFSQILGLFQIYVVGDTFDGVKSNKFKAFTKALDHYFDMSEPPL